MAEILEMTNRGLFCPAGDFYIDPWRSVDRAVVTHAHSDHARPGMRNYLCSAEGETVLRLRVGAKSAIQALEYGEVVEMNGVKLSLHPAGHILGSSQVRVELNGEVIVVSGDYKTEADSTCTPFHPVKCHTFITESTFGLPIYRWAKEGAVFSQVNDWWRNNQAEGFASVLYGYSLGKSQRALAGLDPGIGPIFEHETLRPYTNAYRSAGIQLPKTKTIGRAKEDFDWAKAMILAPPGSMTSAWRAHIGPMRTAFMSGWMAVRKGSRGRGGQFGFVVSDHVDWPSLMSAIAATEAERVLVTHGFSKTVVRYLRETGLEAYELGSEWTGEQE